MRTFVMRSLGQVGFMDKPIPTPGPDDAIIRTTRALICTSDSHTVHGAIGPRENLTLGHEAVGVVHEVGSNVKLFKPGDRVVVGAITPDWGDPAAQAVGDIQLYLRLQRQPRTQRQRRAEDVRPRKATASIGTTVGQARLQFVSVLRQQQFASLHQRPLQGAVDLIIVYRDLSGRHTRDRGADTPVTGPG